MCDIVDNEYNINNNDINYDNYSEYGNTYYSEYDSTTDITDNTTNAKYIYKKIVEKGFHKFLTSDKGQLLKIGFYETNITPGSLIRSAITGNRYEKFKVGSYIEDLFFKVCNTTIETGSRCPLYLFFDSPQEFENHFKCKISDEIKIKWKIKYEIAMKRREIELNKEIFSK